MFTNPLNKTYPLGSYSSRQWAAVRTKRGLIRVPPHRHHLKTSTRADRQNASYVCAPSDLFLSFVEGGKEFYDILTDKRAHQHLRTFWLSSLCIFRPLLSISKSFLDAFSHLYKRVCRSVGPSVRRSHTSWISKKSDILTKMEQDSIKNTKLYHLTDSLEISMLADRQNASDVWTPLDLLLFFATKRKWNKIKAFSQANSFERGCRLMWTH